MTHPPPQLGQEEWGSGAKSLTRETIYACKLSPLHFHKMIHPWHPLNPWTELSGTLSLNQSSASCPPPPPVYGESC